LTSNQRRIKPKGKKNIDNLFLYNAWVVSFENTPLFKKNVLVFFLSSSELQWQKVIIEIGPSREQMFRKISANHHLALQLDNSTSPMTR